MLTSVRRSLLSACSTADSSFLRKRNSRQTDAVVRGTAALRDFAVPLTSYSLQLLQSAVSLSFCNQAPFQAGGVFRREDAGGGKGGKGAAVGRSVLPEQDD